MFAFEDEKRPISVTFAGDAPLGEDELSKAVPSSNNTSASPKPLDVSQRFRLRMAFSSTGEWLAKAILAKRGESHRGERLLTLLGNM